MTWAFAYLAALIVGLVLASVTGLLRDVRSLSRHRHLVVPHADQYPAFLNVLGRRLAIGLVFFGVVGLVVGARWVSDRPSTALAALVAGVAGLVLGFLFYRRPSARTDRHEHATVVREIPPGGYGQVRFERAGGSVVLAAQNIDQIVIPAGSEVEVVDATRSVVTVRRQIPA
ncbi:MAG TPA: hypothetical protein VMT45_05460 [Thermoanaerobaculaceae bacterium]|nr:hypothetical protein [Thermoanaerobaculaceae bacterium]